MFEWEDDFDQSVLNRGWRYAREGAIQHITKKGSRIEAVVRGSEYYRVQIVYDGHSIEEAHCTCPYAAGGNRCKHMAAVLYEVDQNRDKTYYGVETNIDTKAGSSKEYEMLSVEEMIRSADRKLLEEILIDFAQRDDKTESNIRAMLARNSKVSDIGALEKEIDNIFDLYSDRGGFIDYYNAMEFSRDLIMYLENRTAGMIDDGMYLDAFRLTIYAYVKLGNCDIDDDGEIEEISGACYQLWQKIVTRCSVDEKEKIRNWFIEHSEDGTVIDYMEDTLQDFLKYELASDDELKEEMRYLDRLIEESKGSNNCQTVYTSHYGYNIEAIELKILLMKKLGISDEEIDAFRRQHLSFRSVRKYFLKKAQDEGNSDEEVKILNESKVLDADNAYMMHSYSQRLVELYHERKEYDLEKAERKEDFLSYQMSTVDDFKEYRNLCTEEEWLRERENLIQSRVAPESRCELFAEERMLPELYSCIITQNDRLALFNLYGFLLAEDYAEPILAEYREYVSNVAENARNRAIYDILTRYLKRMQQYPGGNELVRRLCMQWISRYPTRKVMVEELNKVMRGVTGVSHLQDDDVAFFLSRLEK